MAGLDGVGCPSPLMAGLDGPSAPRSLVMAGLDPAIQRGGRWMLGSEAEHDGGRGGWLVGFSAGHDRRGGAGVPAVVTARRDRAVRTSLVMAGRDRAIQRGGRWMLGSEAEHDGGRGGWLVGSSADHDRRGGAGVPDAVMAVLDGVGCPSPPTARRDRAVRTSLVMAGLDPAIQRGGRWMLGSEAEHDGRRGGWLVGSSADHDRRGGAGVPAVVTARRDRAVRTSLVMAGLDPAIQRGGPSGCSALRPRRTGERELGGCPAPLPPQRSIGVSGWAPHSLHEPS